MNIYECVIYFGIPSTQLLLVTNNDNTSLLYDGMNDNNNTQTPNKKKFNCIGETSCQEVR